MSKPIKKGDRVRVNTGGFDPRDGCEAKVLAVKGTTLTLQFDGAGSLNYDIEEVEKV